MDEARLRSIYECYVIDFFEHLRHNRVHRRQFLSFYPIWKRLREDNLVTMRKLVSLLSSVEGISDVGYAAATGGGIYATIGQVSELLLTRCVSHYYAFMAVVAHGLKLGFEAAKADAISATRQKVSSMLAMDLSETRAFVRMGLESYGILRMTGDVETSGRNVILRMTSEKLAAAIRDITPTPEQSRNNVNAIVTNAPELQVVNTDMTVAISTGNVREAVARAAPSAVQMTFDFGLTQGPSNLIGSQAMNNFYISGAMISVFKDARDLSRSAKNVLQLIYGTGSVTQNEVKEIIEWLDLELQYVNEVFSQLMDRNVAEE